MNFCTSIHCMDGRIQEPIIQYLKELYGILYVDTITEPGPNKILAEQTSEAALQSIHERVRISVEKHGSHLIAVSGHHDCAGNPNDETVQQLHIEKSVEYLKSRYPEVKIIGLWIDSRWEIHQKFEM